MARPVWARIACYGVDVPAQQSIILMTDSCTMLPGHAGRLVHASALSRTGGCSADTFCQQIMAAALKHGQSLHGCMAISVQTPISSIS